jgi:dolichol-phosphate mannosyltransferase
MKPVILIPTYNEALNIEILINKILSLNIDPKILVVDDNSPDGTGKIVQRLSEKNPNIILLSRTGIRGRGIAGIEGMLYALKLDIDCLIEMDADLSHDPSYIPEFLKEIKEYDVVIGSRCIEGGGEEGRNLLRRWISFLGHIYLRLILGFKIADPSSGYRCFRREVLEKIGLENFVSIGPTIVTEILYAVHKGNFRIKEIPILFKNRRFGSSKLNLKILLLSLWFPIKLRIKNLKEKFYE